MGCYCCVTRGELSEKLPVPTEVWTRLKLPVRPVALHGTYHSNPTWAVLVRTYNHLTQQVTVQSIRIKTTRPGLLGYVPWSGSYCIYAQSTTFCGDCAKQLLYKLFSLVTDYSFTSAKMLVRRIQKVFVDVEYEF